MKKDIKIILVLLCWLMAFPVLQLSAQDDKKDDKEDEKSEKTDYEKLFDKKRYKTVKGLITLHKIDEKVYFEFPKDLLGRKMLLGSTVEEISNSEYGIAGLQAHDPLCVYFTKGDSAIQIRYADFTAVADEENISEAIRKNNLGAIMGSFKIKAVSPDSTAYVFEATTFFVDGKEYMDPFLPASGLFAARKSTFKSENSQLSDIFSYEDNISITSYLSYEVTSTFMGVVYEDKLPATALMKRSLVLLPEEKMRPRINDPRIGVFYNGHAQFSSKYDGMKPIYYANRWRLEPKDTLKFKRGELTEPVEPIVFYIDPAFPPKWKEWVEVGINRWNMAYEKIGFKNALVTKPYPVNDPEFDPNNIKFSCIKYAPVETENSMGPSWVDPRTGEILSASVYLYHGVVNLISDWLFIQTSVVDKRVRTKNIPDEIMGEAISYVAAHEVGHCLGLMHNMAASSAFPVDSLRSPTFTQKYGTTPSIMDYARFNFIAQEGDLEKGVKLTPPELGVYDYYAIKWLYSPIFEAGTPRDEVPVLSQWISEKIQDPMYRYGKQQVYSSYDPSSQTEDLGDDQVKATAYAFSNLKYILENMNDWVKGEDPNYSFRRKMAFSVINIQFYWYFKHVLANIGGIYLYEKYESDPGPAYKSVPKDVQKESMLFLLDAIENLSWMNNAEVVENIDGLHGNAAHYLRSALFPYVMRWVANIGLSEAKADEEPYTRAECISDVFNFVWGSTLKGEVPGEEKLAMQRLMVSDLIINSKARTMTAGGNVFGLQDMTDSQVALVNLEMLRLKEEGKFESMYHAERPTSIENSAFDSSDVSGFGFLRRFVFQSDDITHIYYGWLIRNKEILEKLVKKQKGEVKKEYEYLLFQVNSALDTTK